MLSQKKINLLRLQTKILITYQKIIQFIFKHLPIFLDANSMVNYDKVCLSLKEAEKVKTDKAFDKIMPELENGLQELQTILKNTLTELQQALQRNYSKLFIDKIKKAKKLWQQIIDGAKELNKRISNDELTKNTIMSFEKALTEFIQSAKDIWMLWHKLLQDNSKKPPKSLPQKHLTLMQKILEKRSYVDGGKWIILNENHHTFIGLLQKLLKPDQVESVLTQLLVLFKNYCAYRVKQTTDSLQKFFGEDYQEAYDVQQELLFLQNWLRILESRSAPILKLTGRGINFALQAKQLVYGVKNDFYMGFYIFEKPLNIKTIIELNFILKQNGNLAPDVILDKLYKQQETLDTRIETIETQLKSYSWLVGFTASAIRLYTGNFYFRFSKEYFIAANDVTHKKFKKNTLLGTKLTDTFINIWSIVLASASFSADIYISKRFGVSYTLLTTVSRMILSDLTTVMAVANEFDIDKKTVVRNIDAVKESLSFCIMVGFNTLRTGISTGNFVYFSGAYLAATMARRIIGKLFDCYIVSPVKQQQTKGFGVAKGILQYGGFMLGSKVWHESYVAAHDFFNPPTTQELLQSKKLCLRHKTLCRKTMSEILQVNYNATLFQVRKRWRNLAKKTHPDLVNGVEKNYTLFNNAKTRLVEIIREEKPANSF